MSSIEQEPLVSCIMPTYNRRQFVPNAIQYFLRQDYNNKELIIIDDSTEPIEDLIPRLNCIRYYRLNEKITLGAKLNLACEYAKGKIIANWDDDDWYASRRLKYQVDTLQRSRTKVCGINHLFYYDLSNNRAYQYIYPRTEKVWLLGSSLCYTKEFWASNRFADINVGMDALFVWNTTPSNITVLDDATIAVHMIHKNNVSPKKTDGSWWHPYSVEEIQKILKNDWVVYKNDSVANEDEITRVRVSKYSSIENLDPVTNVYACLVHENENCIIDLVRNLRYNDPASAIILYDGSERSDLLQSNFPYERFGATIHPKPSAARHGYLHTFALDCMQFALDNLNFDTLTIVDSDQLSIRSGYSYYLGGYLSSHSNVGMLSSKPDRITKESLYQTEVWPANLAYKEYELWKPLLQSFSHGEEKFVHWTYWPSTVFMHDAVKDLVQLFKGNKQLHEVMEKTKIWATEEVILPTLVRLLGYEIIDNPCTYDFVKYKRTFTTMDINNAFNREDAYWIHPVERKYENSNRKYIREHFKHYTRRNSSAAADNHNDQDLFLVNSVIKQVRKIEGWLTDDEADLLIALTIKACKESSLQLSIVEIGSYQGKSTVLFASVLKAFYRTGKVYAIDTHDGILGAADQGFKMFPPSFDNFKRNITSAGIGNLVEIIRDKSYNVKWCSPIAILFIDGLHDYSNVARDFWHFSEWIQPGGYVAFHDYVHYYPGVQALVDELVETNEYKKMYTVDTLIVLQKV